MSYRSASDGFTSCRRCGADLANGASFCAECGTPHRAARPMPTAAGQRGWLPVAIIAGGIAAIGAGVMLAIVLGGRSDAVATDPTASASASEAPLSSLAATPSTAASDSAAPTPTAVPTPEGAAIMPNRAIVAVTTDTLNLRSQPNDSASIVAEMERDRRLFVIGEPTVADDLRWYRVGAVGSQTCESGCDLLGYVATPVAAGDPWIEEVDINCPTSPMTDEALGALQPLEALHCYGRNDIVVTGTIETPCCGYVGAFTFSPEWLSQPTTPAFFRTSGTLSTGFRAHPDTDLEPPARGDVVRAIGHFEDPAATSCRVALDPSFDTGGGELVELPNPARVILNCRATFVWTGYEVTGHEDLGPCCGGLPEAPVAVGPVATRARLLA